MSMVNPAPSSLMRIPAHQTRCFLADEKLKRYRKKVPATGTYKAIIVGYVSDRNEVESSFILSGAVYGVSRAHHRVLLHQVLTNTVFAFAA